MLLRQRASGDLTFSNDLTWGFCATQRSDLEKLLPGCEMVDALRQEAQLLRGNSVPPTWAVATAPTIKPHVDSRAPGHDVSKRTLPMPGCPVPAELLERLSRQLVLVAHLCQLQA